jgi:phospholipase C
MNGVLMPQASYAEAYYNPPKIHPSEPNYIWLEAGDNHGIRNDSGPLINHLPTHAHLTNLLEAAGVSWRAYAEGISGNDCPLRSTGRYAARHVPFLYFDDITSAAERCRTHIRPFAELAGDLEAGRVARYNFITPDLCDDMHDRCGTHGDRIRQGDNWLAKVVPPILASSSWRAGGAIIITWDEGEHGVDGPIGLVVLSPLAKGHGFHNRIRYDHSSTLRTLETWFGVSPMLGGAATATDLHDLFTF